MPSRPSIGGDIKKPGVAEPANDRTPVKAFVSLQNLWRVTLADLGRSQAPILLLRSRVDHVVEPKSARLLIAGATATTVREVILEDSYHVATLDNDAELIFTSSVEFIQRAQPRPASPVDDGSRDRAVLEPARPARQRPEAASFVPLAEVDAALGELCWRRSDGPASRPTSSRRPSPAGSCSTRRRWSAATPAPS